VLLLLDIGNSQTAAALCDPASGNALTTWRFPTDVSLDAKGWKSRLNRSPDARQLELQSITDVAISSVVPAASEVLTSLMTEWLAIEPLVVSSNLKLGVRLAVEQPERLGADRVCNATAAYECVGGAAIVVDTGTATKIEAIDAEGILRGGAIAPGIGVSLETLIGRTAQLFSVPLEFPDRAIGRNTIEAMQSGLLIGHLALIEGLVHRFQAALGVPAPIVLTGGYAPLFWKRSDVFSCHEPNLTLQGLLRLWRLNR
jgi:type III pantothenate kinase